MAPVILAGTSCAGAPLHTLREWAVSADRHLLCPDESIADAMRFGLRLAIPGSSEILTVDARRFVAVCADGTAWKLDTRATPVWRPYFGEADNVSNEPVFLAAGQACRVLWAVTRDRKLVVLGPEGMRSPVAAPIPGTARVIGAKVGRDPQVILDDGTVLAWYAARWYPTASIVATLRVRCLQDVPLADWKNARAGEVVDLPEAEAKLLISRGAVAAVEPA